MAIVNDFIRIKPIAYNYLNQQDNSIVNGESFNCNKRFMIISAKPIPKQYKTYVEFTINRHPSNPTIRFIPIYLGIHKEPSFGMLNSDFCIGTVYYLTTSENLDFDIMERYNAAAETTHQTVPKLFAKIPIEKTVIGVGVDIPNNSITLYSDGKEFYSFSPVTFKLNEQEEDMYFVLYSMFNEQLTGFINYGRYKTTYLPEGYWNLYQYYYNKYELSDTNGQIEFPCVAIVNGVDRGTNIYYDWELLANINNNLAPVDDENHQRRLYLIHKFPIMNYQDDLHFRMESSMIKYKEDEFIPNPDNINITFANLPCPTEQKIYFEFNIQNAEMIENYFGIPISIGISTNKDKIDIKSTRINLFHESYHRYTYINTLNKQETSNDIKQVLSPSTPTQPNTIGVIIDLTNNKLFIYLDNVLFVSIPLLEMNDWRELHYIFIRSCDEAYTGELFGECNFGENEKELEFYDEAKKDFPDLMTLYEYYNYTIRYPIPNPPEFLCKCFVIPYYKNYNRFFYCSCFVYGEESEEEKSFSPGLNKLWDTFNIISDTEEKNNYPDKTVIDMFNDIENTINDRRILVPYDILCSCVID